MALLTILLPVLHIMHLFAMLIPQTDLKLTILPKIAIPSTILQPLLYLSL